MKTHSFLNPYLMGSRIRTAFPQFNSSFDVLAHHVEDTLYIYVESWIVIVWNTYCRCERYYVSINLVESTCAHQKLQKIRGGAEDPLQHSRDEEFVQHPLHSPKIYHV